MLMEFASPKRKEETMKKLIIMLFLGTLMLGDISPAFALPITPPPLFDDNGEPLLKMSAMEAPDDPVLDAMATLLLIFIGGLMAAGFEAARTHESYEAQ